MHSKTHSISSGPCTVALARRLERRDLPPTTQPIANAIPKPKNPTRKAQNPVKPPSRIRFFLRVSGGVQFTFAIMIGYKKDSRAGTVLLRNTSSVSAAFPK